MKISRKGHEEKRKPVYRTGRKRKELNNNSLRALQNMTLRSLRETIFLII